MTGANQHGGLIAIDGAGILILGPARSGKSALGLCLLRLARREGHDATLVADDQVLLSAQAGRLIGRAPDSLAGLMEISGVGILRMPHAPDAPVVLAVSLSDDPPRMPDAPALTLHGVSVRQLHLPARQASLSAEVVLTILTAG